MKINEIPTVWRFGMHLVLLLISLMALVPLILVLSASLSEETAVSRYGYSIIPREFSTFAYEYILSEPTQIVRSYGVTLSITLLGTLLGLLISSMLAYTISRRDFPYRNSLSFYVFFVMLFNGGLVPFYLVMTQYYHLKNSLGALILPYLVVPFFVLILRTYFAQLPSELIESAKIEGAGEFRIFFGIVIPLSTPSLATVGLFIILVYWNDFYLALLFIDDSRLFPLQLLLYNIMENINAISANPQMMGAPLPASSARMAIAVLAAGPAIFAFLLVQKYFVRGLTIGALKG